MSDSPDNSAEEGVDPKIWSAKHLHQRNFLRISSGCLRLQLFVQLLPSSLHLQEGKLSSQKRGQEDEKEEEEEEGR